MRIFAFLFAVLAIPTINAKAMDLSKEQADVWIGVSRALSGPRRQDYVKSAGVVS